MSTSTSTTSTTNSTRELCDSQDSQDDSSCTGQRRIVYSAHMMGELRPEYDNGFVDDFIHDNNNNNTIENPNDTIYRIDCLNGDVNSKQLKDSTSWDEISIEMFRKGNINFIYKFQNRINFDAVCSYFTTAENALSEQMFMEFIRFFKKDNVKQLSCVNLRNVDFFKQYQGILGESLKENTFYTEWYNKWCAKPVVIGGGFARKITPEERKTHPAMPAHYKKKQASPEERKLANQIAGITPDPFNLAETPAPVQTDRVEKLPADAIKHPIHHVGLVENFNTKTVIYEYRDILPNCAIDREVRKPFIGRDPNARKALLDRIPTPTVELNPNAYFYYDGGWYAETNLKKYIGFIIKFNVVPTYILQHYKEAICDNIEFISGSNCLTQEFIMYFGEILDWERINPLLYTPEIVANYPTKVFTKYVFMMPEYEQLPNKTVFDDAYKDLMNIIALYKSEREAIIEKMAREQFVRPSNSDNINMQDYFMSTLQENL